MTTQTTETEKPPAENPAGTWALVRAGANLPESVWSDERIRALRNFIGNNVRITGAELSAFLAVCHRYDLDPFIKEAWLVKDDKGRAMTMTGRDTFVKAATKAPGYRGIEQGVVRDKDKFRIIRKEHDAWAEHEINGITPEDRGPVVGAYCIALHETRAPVVIVRSVKDYAHLMHKDNWKRYLEDMIETRAITAALRRQFSLAGLIAEHELAEDGAEAESELEGRLGALQQRLSGEAPSPKDEVEDADFETVAEEEKGSEPPAAAEAEGPMTAEETNGKPDDPATHEAKSKLTLRWKTLCMQVGITDTAKQDRLRRERVGHVSKMTFMEVAQAMQMFGDQKQELLTWLKDRA